MLTPPPTEDVEDEPVAFGLTALLAAVADDDEAGDACGPAELDLAEGLSPAAIDDEPLEDPAPATFGDLVTEPLPALDDDGEGTLDEAEIALPFDARDEPPPPWSETPWRWLPVTEERSPRRSIAVGTERLVTAGPELVWRSFAGERLAVSGANTRLTSVALIGPAPMTALAVVEGGAVLQLSAAGVVPSADWRDVLPGSRAGDEGIELFTLTSGVTSSVLGLTTRGRLLRSDDAGQHWHRVELDGVVFALSTGIDTPLALLAIGEERWLARGSHDGRIWVRQPLKLGALLAGGATDAKLTGIDGCVLITHPDRGAALSVDGGATFRSLSGLTGATALAAGRLGGRPVAWLALFREAAGETELVSLDLDHERALRVARVNPDDAELGEARVEALGWDDVAGRLWAVGSFGLGSFSPPRQ